MTARSTYGKFIVKCSDDAQDSPPPTEGFAPNPQPSQNNQSRYGIMSGIASLGALETGYLTLSKLAGIDAACPLLPGSSCGDVLDSPWGTLLGLPLPLFGFLAYSAVVATAQVCMRQQESARWPLLGLTSAMLATSGFLMYILVTQLNESTCLYCIGSAALSTALWLLSLQSFRREELGVLLTGQIGVMAAVVVALSVSFSDARLAIAGVRSGDFLPPIAPLVTTHSTSAAQSVAQHLHAIGAKMYGAFWCSHCHEQKQMLGEEAMKYIDYVECFPEGYYRGVSLAKECSAADIHGFPTWVIDGEVYPGELELDQLAQASNFQSVESLSLQ